MQNIYIFTKKELAEFADALYLKGKSDAEYAAAVSMTDASVRIIKERLSKVLGE